MEGNRCLEQELNAAGERSTNEAMYCGLMNVVDVTYVTTTPLWLAATEPGSGIKSSCPLHRQYHNNWLALQRTPPVIAFDT